MCTGTAGGLMFGLRRILAAALEDKAGFGIISVEKPIRFDEEIFPSKVDQFVECCQCVICMHKKGSRRPVNRWFVFGLYVALAAAAIAENYVAETSIAFKG